MDKNLLDRESREKIENELDKNFFVEAGAGSGKTYHLVLRMVNLIKKGKVKIENLTAVTFTRKAAAELKERFQIKLEQSLKEGTDPREKANIAEALANMEQVFIGTIHSFCSKILRERPVEAGVDPGFTEIKEEEDSVYAENSWSLYMENCHLDGRGAALDFFKANGILPDELKDSYKKIIQFPDVEIVTKTKSEQDMAKPDFTDERKLVGQFVAYLKEIMPKEVPENGWDNLQKLIRKAVYFIDNGYLGDDVSFVKMLKDLGRKAEVTQKKWPDGNGKFYEEQMEKFQNETVNPAVRKWQEYLHKPCADFIKSGAQFYSNWRKEHSILNFTDLLSITSDLLRKKHEVRSYFKERFTHILVDEFQDTDPIQAEIFLFLTGADTGEADWRKIDPVPGSLFLVGDPKQSIYRFRRADISIYNDVKKIFDGGSLTENSNACTKGSNTNEVLSLFSNFRSLPFMQDIVEEVFGNVFPGERDPYQARYFPLNTVRSANPVFDYGIFENIIAKVPKNNAAQAAADDAENLAAWIDYAVNMGGLKLERTSEEEKSGLGTKAVYSDFLILSRKREHLGLYARALEARGIPYDISGGKVFNKSVELCEILKLFKAIEDDSDPVALVTALRGLFFGISDVRLYEFSIAGGKFSFYGTVPGGFDEFTEAYNRLKNYKNIVSEKEPLVAAEIIIEDLGIIPLTVSREEGLTRAGNIYKALELLRDYNREDISLFIDVVKNLEELLKVRDVESLSLLASRQDVVRIMNLHKAKGLEAPVVMLADPLGEAGEFDPELHISRSDSDGVLNENNTKTEFITFQQSYTKPQDDLKFVNDNVSKGYFCIIKSDGNYGRDIIGIPPEWDDKSAEEIKYDRAERKRLEYVAVTRAKNILVVSTYCEGSRAKAWEILYDYLKKNNIRQISAGKGVKLKEPEVISISPEKWKEEKAEMSEIIDGLKNPGYKIIRVTTEAKESFSFDPDENGLVESQQNEGEFADNIPSQADAEILTKEVKNYPKSGSSGIKWGILAHKALEIAGRGNTEKVKMLSGQWARDAGLGKEASSELISLVQRFTDSDLFERISRAEKKYFEVPFALTHDGSVIHGIIDLVFQEGSKWVIVDYKTGSFEADSNRRSTYQKQLELYKNYWEKISGQEVSETILYKI